MANAITQLFIPGPRLIDGTDLNTAVQQANTAFAGVGYPGTMTNTAIVTIGAGTLTAAAIVGRVITRTGSIAAYTDTTDTAVAIVAAIAGAATGLGFLVQINNNTAFNETIAGGTGVTMAGLTVIPQSSTGTFLVKLTSLTAITMTGIAMSDNTALPAVQFVTASLTAGTIPAASVVGSVMCYWQNTGATPGNQTFPTAATLFAAIPGAYAGMSVGLRIINTGAGTLTLVADGGATVTLAGTSTVAQNVTRDFVITFTTAAAATVQSVGSGVSP